jgi:hypothetical protein
MPCTSHILHLSYSVPPIFCTSHVLYLS